MMKGLTIFLNKPPEGFRPINHTDGASDFPLSAPQLMVYLANLHKDDAQIEGIKNLFTDCFSNITSKSKISDFEDCLSKFENKSAGIIPKEYILFFSSVIAHTLLDEREPLADIPTRLLLRLGGAFGPAERFAILLAEPNKRNRGGQTNKEVAINLLSMMNAEGLVEIPCRLFFGNCGDEFKYLFGFDVCDFLSIVVLAAMTIISENIPVRICKNCGDYFIPSSRADEVYCDKRLPGGKTCKTMGYDERIKDDGPLREYRKIYKTQNARKQRHSHSPHVSEYFDRWKVFAKEKLAACQNGEISLDDMIAQISTDTWLHGELPK